MPSGRSATRLVAYTVLAVVAAALVLAAAALRLSLPAQDGEIPLAGLGAPVTVELDDYGIPRISAGTREDAFLALGFVTARERLFQMDLLRRAAAGRLAEVFGAEALGSDEWHRRMGFERVAAAILARLPAGQRAVLESYSRGVNHALEGFPVLPFEFLALGYRALPWRPEDSLLIVLGMYETLTWGADQELMATVMEAALPAPWMAFLTPDERCEYALTPDARARPCRAVEPPPEIVQADLPPPPVPLDGGVLSKPPRGSNAWVVAPARTRDARAILANDMHLPLGVPNVFYRAELRYQGRMLAGVTLPGVPSVVAGSNGRVAWGLTSIEGDLTDLVLLDPDPEHPAAYRTHEGARRYGERRERIRVRGAPDIDLAVQESVFGPLLPEPLLGRPVAVRWTALDPEATDLSVIHMDRVSTVDEALALLSRAGGPPVSALLADAAGHIGWTLTGRIPMRIGMSGLYARPWGTGHYGWRGYLPPERLPRIVDPESGMIVSANQRMSGPDEGAAIGHDYSGSFRAHRIATRLGAMTAVTEPGLFEIQLDTESEVYSEYRRLALDTLSGGVSDEASARLRRDLSAWDGRAEPSSRGLPVLVAFRRALLDAVLTPLFASCRALAPGFAYAWSNADVPVLRLLEMRRGARDRWVVEVLKRAASDIQEGVGWGTVNRVRITHPLSGLVPGLGRWLDMPAVALPGCDQCVRLADGSIGAGERLVISPGREADGILHIPGGQSGHPLSPHYRDQQPYWAEGRPAPFMAGAARHRLFLKPANSR